MPASVPTSPPAPFRAVLARLLGWRTPTDTAPTPSRSIPQRAVASASIGRGYEAQGYRKGVRRIVVTVDGDLFKRVRADAVRSSVSLAAQVREILNQHYAAKEPRTEA